MLLKLFSRGNTLIAGDLVEVRSAEEILATLDEHGNLEGLPFMPEMLAYCGKQMRVDKVAHKTCDTVRPVRGRTLLRAVHLEGIRCNGAAHDGCQALCTFFWKEAWLKKVGTAKPVARSAQPSTGSARCTVETLQRECRRPVGPDGVVRYRCQATDLPDYTGPLAWWNPWQYIMDAVTGNWSVGHVLRVVFLGAWRRVIETGVGYRAQIATYNVVARSVGGRPWCNLVGPLPRGAPTPGSELNVAPGDVVRIRPRAEIVATLSETSKNRGLMFDPEMERYCGSTHRVRSIITRIIDEKTGAMIDMKQPCIVLQDVYCKSDYSKQRLMCPRAIVSYWRPLWLEKLPADTPVDPQARSS